MRSLIRINPQDCMINVPLLNQRGSAADLPRERIVAMVSHFYAQVRSDTSLGPFFAAHVSDWAAHEARLVQFWSGLLLGERGFDGSPLSRHLALEGLEWAHFESWLRLFARSAALLEQPAMESLAIERAGRIAEHFWRHYRQHRSA